MMFFKLDNLFNSIFIVSLVLVSKLAGFFFLYKALCGLFFTLKDLLIHSGSLFVLLR